MKFFVPFSDSQTEQQHYQQLKNCAESTGFAILEDRIYHLSFFLNGTRMEATVGEPMDGAPVLAIFKTASCYVIVTPARGVVHDRPLLVDFDETRYVEHFE